MRQLPPLGSRTWRPEEEDYLMETWGQLSVPTIAKKLNRTTNAVKVRAQRLGLGAVLMSGEYVTLNQLITAVTGSEKSYSYKIKSWVENRGMPAMVFAACRFCAPVHGHRPNALRPACAG